MNVYYSIPNNQFELGANYNYPGEGDDDELLL